MTVLSRVRVGLSGFAGAPGVSTFYALDTGTIVDALHDFYAACALFMPGDVHIHVEPEGDLIEDTTGNLTGSWSAPSTADVVGAQPGGYSAPSGACVTWTTDTVLDAKRVRGRTFLVPLASNAYDDGGTLLTACITALHDAAVAFQLSQDTSFVIWHRPFAGKPAVPPKPARPAHPGGHALVTNVRVVDKAAVLRSRRD